MHWLNYSFHLMIKSQYFLLLFYILLCNQKVNQCNNVFMLDVKFLSPLLQEWSKSDSFDDSEDKTQFIYMYGFYLYGM